MSLQLGLHLTQTDVLAKLQLHQVLLTINDPQRSVLEQLPDVTSPKPSLAAFREEILRSELIIFEISCNTELRHDQGRDNV